MTIVDQLFLIASYGTFVFFVLYALATLALIGLSLLEASATKIERGDTFTPPPRLRRPGITVVTPAYNEEAVVVASTRSLLGSDYAPLEVVIVDDGSGDGTTAALARAFDLIELPVGDRFRIPTQPIEQIYVSRRDPRLRVLRKRNGGRSDAINAGLNVARQELVAIVDSDSLLDRDALLRIAEVFAADPDDVVAVGGTIRIANGAVIEHGIVTRPRVAVSGTEASQMCEYLRGFLSSRIAWSRLNGLLIISGAFGVFRADLVRAVGGLSSATLGEDMELVMRLHHLLRPTMSRARIAYAPDANCWTEAPAGLGPLRGQRIRWHVGLIDNLRLHRRMIGRRRFGAVGMVALPYAVLFEAAAPLMQIAGYSILIVLIVLGLAPWEYALGLVIIAALAAQLETAGAILIEEIGFRRYRSRDLMLLGLWGLLETLWYRPLTAWWRTWTTVLLATGRRPGWGSIPRGGALGDEEAEGGLLPAPLPR